MGKLSSDTRTLINDTFLDGDPDAGEGRRMVDSFSAAMKNSSVAEDIIRVFAEVDYEGALTRINNVELLEGLGILKAAEAAKKAPSCKTCQISKPCSNGLMDSLVPMFSAWKKEFGEAASPDNVDALYQELR